MVMLAPSRWRVALTLKNYPTQNVSNANVERPCARQ